MLHLLLCKLGIHFYQPAKQNGISINKCAVCGKSHIVTYEQEHGTFND